MSRVHCFRQFAKHFSDVNSVIFAGTAIEGWLPGPQPSEALGLGPFYYKKDIFTIQIFKNVFLMKRARLLRKNERPLPGTQQDEHIFWVVFVFCQKNVGSDLQIAMSGATDPTNPPISFDSFEYFLAKIRHI